MTNPDVTTSPYSEAEALKAVVRRNTELVQGQGDFALFDELFADDFVDHTPQPGTTPDKAGVRVLYHRLGVAPTGKALHFETVDAMRVRDGKITDHWGVANLYSVLQQLGQLPPA